jgi:site-specific DNA recombinase
MKDHVNAPLKVGYMGRKKKEHKVVTAADGKRTIIYLRVSTDEQAQHGYGLADQLEKCQKYAELVGYTVIDVKTDEGLSGTLYMDYRPALKDAFFACLTGKADIILAYAQDRYARDTGVWVNLRDAAIKGGMKLWTVKENTDFATKESQFMGEIHAVVASEDRRKIAERLFNGRKQRSKVDGLGGGPTPYGYIRHKEIQGTEIITTVQTDASAVPAIALILSERAAGRTYESVTALLERLRYPTPRGNSKWKVSTIQAIETHETLYRTGVRTWNNVNASTLWPVLLED